MVSWDSNDGERRPDRVAYWHDRRAWVWGVCLLDEAGRRVGPASRGEREPVMRHVGELAGTHDLPIVRV